MGCDRWSYRHSAPTELTRLVAALRLFSAVNLNEQSITAETERLRSLRGERHEIRKLLVLVTEAANHLFTV